MHLSLPLLGEDAKQNAVRHANNQHVKYNFTALVQRCTHILRSTSGSSLLHLSVFLLHLPSRRQNHFLPPPLQFLRPLALALRPRRLLGLRYRVCCVCRKGLYPLGEIVPRYEVGPLLLPFLSGRCLRARG